jgi:osmotically-inducible protein OsmY
VIRTRFAKTSDLRNNPITVEVDDGIAVLEWTIDSEREKKEAQQLAHVDGILDVNNRLEVGSPGK